MELFGVILLGVGVVSGGIFMWMEIGITNDRLRWLDERLTKLEKDAVKITFTSPFTTGDDVIVHPKVKIPPCVGHELESQKENEKLDTNFMRNWIQEKSGKKDSVSKKRKPKTTKDWEDEFDLGGHE
jgi:hypothetical protein